MRSPATGSPARRRRSRWSSPVISRATRSAAGRSSTSPSTAGRASRLDDGEAPDAFVRSGELTRLVHVAVDRSGAIEVEAGRRRPDRDEDHEVGLLRLRSRSVHDAARGRRPAHGHEGPRDLGLPVRARGASGGVRLRRGLEARQRSTLMHSLAEHFSPSVQASIWIMGTAMMDAEPVDRLGPHGAAEPAPLEGRPRAVRARQPRRGVRLDDRAARTRSTRRCAGARPIARDR